MKIILSQLQIGVNASQIIAMRDRSCSLVALANSVGRILELQRMAEPALQTSAPPGRNYLKMAPVKTASVIKGLATMENSARL